MKICSFQALLISLLVALMTSNLNAQDQNQELNELFELELEELFNLEVSGTSRILKRVLPMLLLKSLQLQEIKFVKEVIPHW